MRCDSTFASRNGSGDEGMCRQKKTVGITLTRRGLNLRGFPRRCAWLLRWRLSAASAERKSKMMKFVVNSVVEGRGSSISETVRPGRGIEAGFFGYRREKGGTK
jgi:hypothetical protein